MANCTAVARTNYFRVTDEEKYQELFKHLVADSKIQDFSKEQDGILYHGFEVYSLIDYEVDGEYDFDIFLEELQKILPKEEAFIYQDVGNEKLRYIEGSAIVLTAEGCQIMNITEWIENSLAEMINNDGAVSRCAY